MLLAFTLVLKLAFGPYSHIFVRLRLHITGEGQGLMQSVPL